MNEIVERLNNHPIVYQGMRCVTLGLVDQMHGRANNTAKAAFNRRKDRFKEDHHYFIVPYVEAQKLLNDGTFNVPSKKGGYRGDTIFITEKGYALLAKVFDDDRAWAVRIRNLARAGEIKSKPGGAHKPQLFLGQWLLDWVAKETK